MSTTTALELLEHADVLTRQLRRTGLPTTSEQWESFDITLHRLLLELIGVDARYVPPGDPGRRALYSAACTYPIPLRPPVGVDLTTDQVARLVNRTTNGVHSRIHRRGLRTVREGRDLFIASNDLDERPDIRPADPSDPHTLARISCALGALADLVHDARQAGPPVLDRHGELAGATQHVLSLAAVAARHALAHGPIDEAVRPMLIGRYAERIIDALRDVALHPTSLDRLASVSPEPQPVTIHERLEAALHAWATSARQELERTVPSVDVLRQIANQGAHLCAVAIIVEPAHPEVEIGTASDRVDALRRTRDALLVGERAWDRLTTATRPSHEFVNASRDLFESLREIAVTTKRADKTLDQAKTAIALFRGLTDVANLLTATEALPAQLISAGILRAPAKSMRSAKDRLTERAHGRYVAVLPADALPLMTNWPNACAQALSVTTTIRDVESRHVHHVNSKGCAIGWA